jgi:hypothetical protein
MFTVRCSGGGQQTANARVSLPSWSNSGCNLAVASSRSRSPNVLMPQDPGSQASIGGCGTMDHEKLLYVGSLIASFPFASMGHGLATPSRPRDSTSSSILMRAVTLQSMSWIAVSAVGQIIMRRSMGGKRWQRNSPISPLTQLPDRLPSSHRRSRRAIPTQIRSTSVRRPVLCHRGGGLRPASLPT